MKDASGDLYDVAVVGYGPVGALLANLLGRSGVRTVVFERDVAVYRLPRAVHFDHEIMRILQSIGLSESLLEHTAAVRGYEFWNADQDVLFRFDIGQEVTDQGWRRDYMFHQPSLEAALRGAGATRRSVDIHLEHEVLALDEEDGEVSVRVRDLLGGRERSVRARYVVGCDGANSSVRRCAGLEIEDLEFDEPWLVVDATVEDSAARRSLPEHVVQLCDPARPRTFVPVAGRYIRWEFMLKPGEDGAAMLRPEGLRELIHAWVNPDTVEIIRSAVYHFHALIARSWRTRRVFLAGDAAHQTPPFLGQGMCAGMRDAANLAWKLVLVCRGVASDAILSSYQRERAPHVRNLIDTAVALGRIICTLDPEAAAKRDAEFLASGDRRREVPDMPGLEAGLLQASGDGPPPAPVGKLGLQARVRASDGSARLLDDVVGPGFALLARGNTAPTLSAEAAGWLEAVEGKLVHVAAAGFGAAPAEAGQRLLCVVDEHGAYGRWFDRHACDAALIRPDHYVFGAGAGPDAASALLVELARQLCESAAR